MGIEELDQFGEVGKRSRQPVYLVDDDDVDLAGADVVQQPLKVRPVGRPTPASDVGGACLSLRPKKRGPFHQVPVIAKATLVRLS